MLTILAVIPARGGSKRLPGKNLKKLNGKPLINYPIELALQAEQNGLIAGHIVSTDYSDIASAARKAGGNVSFLRPADLASDTANVAEAAIHAVNWWEENHDQNIDSVLLLQPTSPLTNIDDLKSAITIYSLQQADCLISVCKAKKNQLKTIYRRKGDYIEQLFKDSQFSEQYYLRNGGIYIAKCDLLLNEKTFVNDSAFFYEMPKMRSVAIDDMLDWIIAETLLSKAGRSVSFE